MAFLVLIIKGVSLRELTISKHDAHESQYRQEYENESTE